MDTLPDDVRKDSNRYYPCVILKYRHPNKILTSVMRVCNSFNDLFTIEKLKHSRRCDICLDKTKHFNNCYRCDHRCCSNCINHVVFSLSIL